MSDGLFGAANLVAMIGWILGMHALQALPILGWFFTRRGTPSGERWVGVVAAVWATGTGLLIVQAMAGRPLL